MHWTHQHLILSTFQSLSDTALVANCPVSKQSAENASDIHWCRLVKNIGWANQNIGGGKGGEK